MFAEERQALIADRVATSGRETVAQLAAHFAVTPETVRRDLDALEAARQLRRVHGGAVAIDRFSLAEASIGERQARRQDEKNRIARAALRMIPSSSTGSIILDSGSTTERLADLLAGWAPATPGDQLLVITNAVPIAAKLATAPDVQLHVLGGRVRGLTSAIVGPSTAAQLDALRPDIAFIGANGIHPRFGVSTPDAAEAAAKSAMVHAARRVVALVDSTKLGRETLVRFAALTDIDALITDAEPAAELADALANAGVEVVVV
ncbi:DeoR/GlpR family DNA-binding transcription regulator [Klugiella xanthotipulae]|uniref:Lactose phosphotransferase system repressor n=1 Tax=Klugiella xanthotipulae TaxID=244735 RepID=A0A543I646_9MICO|nr:DeoR/GlpR family DNA-binding transcription regulator [Klugiella xanthotipulae]TQM66073.1 DeoR family transcriptional regulator [Klugiella xanthotipulae]